MSNEEPSLTTRSEKKQRHQRSQKRKKMDRLLNILIAVVSILIVLNLVAVFNNDNDKENERAQVNETKEQEDVANQNNEKNEQTNDMVAGDTEQKKNYNESVEEDPNNNQAQQIVQSSDDPNVDEVIIDPNWKPTTTKQTGEHISTYEEGHIDYEEKLETFRNAVNLEENNIIYWSVKNNGSADSSVAVVSTNDRSEKYRIFIEWVQNEGWKPTKVEKLSQLEGTY
ncbi:DUF1510 family protein [Lysinibacillus telephonicus]|nr:YrrS family protein [Lysinibacillus telephonicus]